MIHNLVEEHVRASYDSLRPRFPAFCGCDICREDALVYTLNRVPSRYVSSRTGTVLTEVNLEKDQSRAAIDVAMLDGFRKISLAPRCGAKGKALDA
ncbi:MAG TPA: late competence development ComFB family protein [Gemmatimonadales bacterium]|nr:late competence development ComFB family protein [Gemmatimonadales bacterium]